MPSEPAVPNPIRVLFVCTGNSARSIMAETLLRQRGGPAFEAHSAGTDPRGINPLTLRVLAEAGLPAEGLPYPVFSYSGMTIWLYFSSGVTAAAQSLVGNRDLVAVSHR